MKKTDPMKLLLVEDNEGDVRLIEEALKDARTPVSLMRAADGEEALSFLRREGAHARAPRPDLVLLDINLPGRNGLDILLEVKQDPALREIPVVMLTTSREPRDVRQSYDRHANSFISKPDDLEGLVRVVSMVQGYWTGVATLPTRADHA